MIVKHFVRFLLLACLASLVLNCPDNCNDCDPSGNICFACSEGFELSVEGKCINDQTVPKCTLYGPGGICFVCQPTYSLENGNCLKNGSPCLGTDPADDNICTNCGFGTVLESGQCKGTINCAKPEVPCSSCLAGFNKLGTMCRDMSPNCLNIGNSG